MLKTQIEVTDNSRVIFGPGSVTLDGQAVPPRKDLRNYHSRLQWGSSAKNGAAVKQTSLAVLALAVGDTLAVHFHEAFAKDIVSELPGPSISISVEFIRGWVAATLRSEQKAA